MTGMILRSETPVYAVLYQFVITVTILVSGGLKSMLISLLMVQRVITEAEQLRQIDIESS